VLLELNRIIGEDRIEIVFCFVRKLELFLIRVMLPLSFDYFSPAFNSLLVLVKEGIVLKEIQYHRREEVVWA